MSRTSPRVRVSCPSSCAFAFIATLSCSSEPKEDALAEGRADASAEVDAQAGASPSPASAAGAGGAAGRTGASGAGATGGSPAQPKPDAGAMRDPEAPVNPSETDAAASDDAGEDEGKGEPDAGLGEPDPAGEEPAPGGYTGIYTDADKWLCRPGLQGNPCTAELTVTEFLPDDTTRRTVLPPPAAEAKADCFYAYPTVDPGLLSPPRNLDFPAIDRAAVTEVMFGQARPFRDLCNLYAPVYRQASLNSFDAEPAVREERLEYAYRDLSDAFDYLLANTSPQRPLILLAHSQGSRHMTRIIQRRIESDAALSKRIVVVLLAGPLGGFSVPEGQRVGGSLAKIPLCGAADETGCVLTWNTFLRTNPPADGWGSVGATVPADQDLGCNPGFYTDALTRLKGALFVTRGPIGTPTIPLDFGPRRRVDTDYARYADFYTARCVPASDGKNYLELAVDPLPEDARDNPVPFDNFVFADPTIGLHALDYAFVSGELVDAVKRKLEAYIASHP